MVNGIAMSTPAALSYRYRLPAEIISHCVWLYFRFSAIGTSRK